MLSDLRLWFPDYTDRLTISGDLLPITFYDDVSNIDDLYRTEGLEWVATS